MSSRGTIHVVGRLCTQEQATYIDVVRMVVDYIKQRNTVVYYRAEDEFLRNARNYIKDSRD
jgi:hypothetical protein